MADYLIGRVAVVDEETKEQTPIDARTRAEAVATTETGKTAQDKIDELNAHIADLAIHSKAYVKTMWQVTIPETGWVLEAPEDADFPYSIELPYEGTLDTHNAEVTVDKESIQIAAACGICPTMETMHNGLKFWSRTIPSAPIMCHMTLFGEGGISGRSAGGEVATAHEDVIASADTLGHVMIGDNIAIDEQGRITPTGATLPPEQTATDQDIDQIIENVFGGDAGAE